MHQKGGELFDRFFPADVESMELAMLTELFRADDERIASSPENSADPIHAFGQADRYVTTVIAHPVIDQVIRVSGFPIVQPIV